MAGCDIVVSPDGRRLALTGWNPVTIWDIQSRRKLVSIDVAASMTMNALFISEGKQILIASTGGTAIWDTSTGEKVREVPGHKVISIAVHPSGRLVALGSIDGGILLREF